MPIPDFYPVPLPPPDEGAQHICRIADAWIPVLIGQMQALRDKSKWVSPPDDIVAQIDHFIYQIETEYVMPQTFGREYFHFHKTSIANNGNAIAEILNSSQAFGIFWRQDAAQILDHFYFTCTLEVGDYIMDICHAKSSGSGKLDVYSPDGFLNTTFDFYNAATQLNQHSIISFSVTDEGEQQFNFIVPGKNASSSGYVINITYIAIRRDYP